MSRLIAVSMLFKLITGMPSYDVECYDKCWFICQGMAAGINNINLPDDMEENPREVLQVGRTCSNPTCPKFSNRPTLQIRRSSVQSRNDSPEVM